MAYAQNPAAVFPAEVAPSVVVIDPGGGGAPWWVEAIAASAGRVSLVEVFVLIAVFTAGGIVAFRGRKWLSGLLAPEIEAALNLIKEHEETCAEKYRELEERLAAVEKQGHVVLAEGKVRAGTLARIESAIGRLTPGG